MDQDLNCCTGYCQDDWVSLSLLAKFAFNNSVHYSTQQIVFNTQYDFHLCDHPANPAFAQRLSPEDPSKLGALGMREWMMSGLCSSLLKEDNIYIMFMAAFSVLSRGLTKLVSRHTSASLSLLEPLMLIGLSLVLGHVMVLPVGQLNSITTTLSLPSSTGKGEKIPWKGLKSDTRTGRSVNNYCHW